RATRPKVERKFAHLMRRKHGGRRARVRGLLRVGNDFSLLAGAANLARMAKLQARSNPCGGWEVAM
ncbi:MAG: transposase, partial [Ferrimicrobium sp.]